ncbi:hypothetical protein [Marinilabilia rubra]|uniref:Uncharacterized protein n=1 Tax=Marinilabilia rubra TaxID=2162893 RepID=A0A2U2BAC2_9BACT|nr:hypothetical protein [Marinilabilia rubra]PWE00014.1 hypothetical protein DDZ16_06525 [Marinilabilia rubra]
MNTIEYSLKIDSESKLINITGITSSPVTIDFSGDVDFTRLVTALTKLMDSRSLLSPKEDNDKGEDNTTQLILATIDSIVEEYNNTVKSMEEPDEEEQIDIEFENEEDLSDNDDLPF